MKTLLLFSLFFSSYLLSSEPGQQAQHPTSIVIHREGFQTQQIIRPGTGEGPTYFPPSSEPGQGGQPDQILVGAVGDPRGVHAVNPGSGPDTTPSR